MQRPIATVDFETESIGPRHDGMYPPKPVGVAVIVPGAKPRYLAWGHPCENNATIKEARDLLKGLFKTHAVLFHNSVFDIEVAMHHLGCPFPEEFHDTLFLAYLYDPRAESLSLKPLADDILGMPAVEQSRLHDWIMQNVPEATEKTWGAYIAKAPGDLVGKYAIGDVVRTKKLFDVFYKFIVDNGMLEAYHRERSLVPIVLDMEQRGIKVAVPRLERDLGKFEKALITLDTRIRKALRVPSDAEFNIGSSKQLADAMESSGKVTHFLLTDKGNRSTKRENLSKTCTDRRLVLDLAMHGVLKTYINTFCKPWLEIAHKSDDYVHPRFNQVRSVDEWGSRARGTRTGRFSSDGPNFQNIPADVEESKNRDTLLALSAFLKESQSVHFIGLRDYLVPDDGCVFIGRDYSQQELRITAHYEDGILLRSYLDDPDFDIHEFVSELVHARLGVRFPRKFIKITVFGIIYGMGAEKLANGLGIPLDEARSLRAAVHAAIPGVKDLDRALKKTVRRNEPIRTWGGRLYYVEEPQMVQGHLWTFEYKMLNLLIQGSAADNTKEAMIRVEQAARKSRPVLQVHDELLRCTPIGTENAEMKSMKEAMESVEFDLPMLSEGKKSSTTWARVKDWEAR